MASLPLRRTLLPLAAVAFLAVPAEAQTSQTSYTKSSGYVQIDITPATSGTAPALSALSATLTNPAEFAGNITVAADFGVPGADQQTINVAGVTWTGGQWTGVPHVFFIKAASGAEESFLILSNTATSVVVSTTFDLLSDPPTGGRFPAATTGTIRKANTIGKLFGETPADVPFKKFFISAGADNIFLFSGTLWITYFHNGTSWVRIPAGAGDPKDDVVFTSEGMFILRRDTGLLTLTFFGDVASAAKILTVPGIGLTLASSGFPVGQTIDNYGFDSLPNWKKFFISAGADKVYVWYNSVNGWATYFHNGTTGWQVIPPAGLSITVADPIPPDSAMFIDRIVVDTAAESGAEVDLPYIP